MEIRDLKIEYRKNPIGLDEVNPRFSWKIESNEKDVYRGRAYRQRPAERL